MTPRVRIAVVAGGRSSEHAISLASARSVIEALDPERYDVVTLLIDETGGWQVVDGAPALLAASEGAAPAELARDGGTSLVPGAGGGALVGVNGASAGEVDVVFPVLHGPFGEDGTIQGLLETIGLPYVGAGVLGSAASMDKAFCKAVLRDAGIAVARSLVLRHGVDDPLDPAVESRIAETLGWPVFVKPANLGSSVGITKVHGPEELADALDLAYRHDPKVIVEEFVAGRELECGVLGNERAIASAVGEILPHAEWYDYSAKYDEGGSDIIAPADSSRRRCRTRARRRPRLLPRTRAQRHGPRRLLPHAAGRGARQRGQHDPRLHVHVRLCAALRRGGRVVPRGARPARAERPRPPRAARALPLLIHERPTVE